VEQLNQIMKNIGLAQGKITVISFNGEMLNLTSNSKLTLFKLAVKTSIGNKQSFYLRG
jgi:hypothetical protein